MFDVSQVIQHHIHYFFKLEDETTKTLNKIQTILRLCKYKINGSRFALLKSSAIFISEHE